MYPNILNSQTKITLGELCNTTINCKSNPLPKQVVESGQHTGTMTHNNTP